jgi:AraC-like DNA-binding protein
MNQFLLQHGIAKELHPFPHIREFAFKRINSIRLNSFDTSTSDSIRFYFVTEGKFEWIIQDQPYTLYPFDLAIVLPGQKLAAAKGHLDIGALWCLHIKTDIFETELKKTMGKWSSCSIAETATIKNVFQHNHNPVIAKLREAVTIFQNTRNEIFAQELGYCTRVNHLIDELLILITRHLTRQNNSHRDFPQTFLKLEETLRKNLSHQWTIEEMAVLMGLGATAFNERVKSFTGFSPLNYLINIRISEAIRLLKRQDVNITSIALDTGFYSSQHFSTTFKKLTGYTPRQFRKNNTSKN